MAQDIERHYPGASLYVCNLPYSFSEQQLYRAFSPFGSVVSAKWMMEAGLRSRTAAANHFLLDSLRLLFLKFKNALTFTLQTSWRSSPSVDRQQRASSLRASQAELDVLRPMRLLALPAPSDDAEVIAHLSQIPKILPDGATAPVKTEAQQLGESSHQSPSMWGRWFWMTLNRCLTSRSLSCPTSWSITNVQTTRRHHKRIYGRTRQT
ncbi:hypothetical protein IRJ41_001674 [Triplophysa rosa]|uniref:RRM domain-containing protein n=1 Tax=Triplophysa rosa TaxID=992332 RepID=A0A9W7WB50_TRIRA|nr:hypothetical protein IRJ41_001674 [Triplophysa rosa]